MTVSSIESRQGGALRRHLKAASQNAALILASLGVFYLVGEALFFRVLLPVVPFNTQVHLPEVPEVLLQTTKSGYMPRDYVALLGDSYAQGLGDWLLEHDGDRSLPYHSANIIHQATGRDVVSFGKPASGSAEGLVRQPAIMFSATRCYLFPSLDEPSQIVYYFFEGNDVEDNWETLQKRVSRQYGDTSPASAERFVKEQYGSPSPWRCHQYFGDTLFRMGRFVVQYHLLGRKKFPLRPNTDGIPLNIAGKTFRATALVGPGLPHDDRETEIALSLFDPSLAWLRERFPRTAVTVVYVPSPLYVYIPHYGSPLGIWLPDKKHYYADADPNGTLDLNWVASRSDSMCAQIRTMSLKNGADFVDARAALRRAAAQQPIHGRSIGAI